MITKPDGITAVDYGDVMVDLETTGTTPGRHGILQIAAVRFDLLRGWIDGEVFQAQLTLPSHLHWDEATRRWWLHPDRVGTLKEITSSQEDWITVMKNFQAWVGKGDPTFWAKPLSFDFPFLSAYFKDAGIHNPFHYRKASDVNSWIRARYWPRSPEHNEYTIGDSGGTIHNALDDAFHQIKLLLTVAEHTRK